MKAIPLVAFITGMMLLLLVGSLHRSKWSPLVATKFVSYGLINCTLFAQGDFVHPYFAFVWGAFALLRVVFSLSWHFGLLCCSALSFGTIVRAFQNKKPWPSSTMIRPKKTAYENQLLPFYPKGRSSKQDDSNNKMKKPNPVGAGDLDNCSPYSCLVKFS